MAEWSNHDPALGRPPARAGYRWERRAGGLRLTIPIKPSWRVALGLGLGTLAAAAAFGALIAVGDPLDGKASAVPGVMFVCGAQLSVVAIVETAIRRRQCVRNIVAITFGEGELVAEGPRGRARRISRAAVVGVTVYHQNLYDGSSESNVDFWGVHVYVADGPSFSLDARTDEALAAWLAATLRGALRLPAASAAVEP